MKPAILPRANAARLAALVVVCLACTLTLGAMGCDKKSSSGDDGNDPPTLTPAEQFDAILAAVATRTPAETATALADFVGANKNSAPHFPIPASATRTIFLYDAAGNAGPYHVAGSFNAWSTSTHPMAEIDGSGWWFAEIDLSAAGNWIEYKFNRQGSTWIADPLNRRFEFSFGNSVINWPGSGKSHLEKWPAVAATQLGNTRDVVVYLPAGFDAADTATKYPVLYAHDGQNLFDPAAIWGGWQLGGTLDALIANQEMRKIIVVGIANTPGRMDEYTHTPDDISGSCSGPIVGGDADKYGHFLFTELKPLMDAVYPTLSDRDHTGLLGSSLGGLVSMYLAYENAGTVRRVAAMSSTFGWGDFCLGNPTMADVVAAAGKQDFLIYIDSGGAGPGDPDQDNYGVTKDMETLLVSQGFQYNIDLVHWWEPNAAHNEAAWAARVDKPLKFLFPPN